MELLLEFGKFFKRLGIVVSTLGVDFISLLFDLDFDLMVFAVPLFIYVIAKNIVIAGDILNFFGKLFVPCHIRKIFPAGEVGYPHQGMVSSFPRRFREGPHPFCVHRVDRAGG